MHKPSERERGWGYLGEEAFHLGNLRDEGELRKVSSLELEVDKDDNLSYNNKVNKQTTMTKQELNALVSAAQNGDNKAKTKLLLQYEKLCHKLARKFAFTAPNHDHDDLFQEAQMGLLKAIGSFDPEAGASFMTWAFYQVRGAVASAGKTDRKQPKYPLSIESSVRAYNVEYENEPEIRDDLPVGLALKLIEDCAGGIGTKRAKIVIDRYGLFGFTPLRNCEVCAKYGISKNAVVSHTYNFKQKVKERYPQLADFV